MDNDDNRPHIRPGDIKYTKGYEIKVAVRMIIRVVVGALFAAVVSGTIYIYINQPALNENGEHITAATTHRLYKIGEDVVFVETEDFNMFTPIKRAFSSNEIYNAKIVAGPYGEIKTIDGEKVVVHGENIVSVNLEERENTFLNEEYVIRKEGLDENKTDEIVSKEEILGLKKTIGNNVK